MKVEQARIPIEKKLKRYLSPRYGRCVFFSGGKGKGKTHEIVNYIYHLTQEIGWHVITNIQFEKRKDLPSCPECGEELNVSSTRKKCYSCGHVDPEGESPPGVHFVTNMSDFWKEFARIRMNEPYTPVVLIIDEFHTTVNRLESHKYWNVVTALMSWLSQMRKFTQSAMFCTQFLKQLPKDPRNYADYFIVKNSKLANKIRTDDRFKGPRYHSFVVKTQGMEVKVLDKWGNPKHVDAEKFKERNINRDLQQLIAHRIIKDTIVSLSCPYNDESMGKWQYRHQGVSVLTFDPINDDECYWFKLLVEKLGEVGSEEVGESILDFFESYEPDDEDEFDLTPFSELSNSRKAVLIYKVSQLTDRRTLSKKDAAAIFGIDRTAINKAEERWDDYLIDSHIDAILTDESEIQSEGRECGRGVPA